MKYLLDTNICIHFFRGKFDLINKFNEIGIENFAISEITFAELVFGAENSADPEKNHLLIDKLVEQITILPIFSSILRYGKLKASLRKQGKMISDFDRIEHIKVENWISR